MTDEGTSVIRIDMPRVQPKRAYAWFQKQYRRVVVHCERRAAGHHLRLPRSVSGLYGDQRDEFMPYLEPTGGIEPPTY